MKVSLIGLVALVCAIPIVSHCQDQTQDPATIDRIANFPTRLLSSISIRDANLQQQLARQTQKYLSRLARKEQKLKARLYRLDSAQAASLYTQDPQQQYQILLQKLRQDSAKAFHSMGPEYLPYADSLQGMLGFLNKNPQLLNANPALQVQLQSSLVQLQQLQSKLRDADAIKQFIQSRKAQFQQFLRQYSHLPSGISSAFQGYNKEAFYYSEQVRQYRQMLNDPDKMLQTALGLLDRLPAFTGFMKQNGFLAGLFNVPAGYGTDQGLIGLQTRDQVLAIIQSQIGQGGGAGAAALQNSLNAAQEDITKLQNKLNSLGGGSGDMEMPNFKPNDQRTKTFFHRLEYGTYLQTTPATNIYPSYSDIGLSLAYKLGHSNTIGVGASYKLGWGTPLQHIAVSNQGAGLRSFADIHLKKSFSLTGGYELNYLTPFSSFQNIRWLSRWTPSGLIGVSKTVSMKSTVFRKTQVSFLWDFLSYYQTPRTQPILFRVGYSF